jgi:hypothetical protein
MLTRRAETRVPAPECIPLWRLVSDNLLPLWLFGYQDWKSRREILQAGLPAHLGHAVNREPCALNTSQPGREWRQGCHSLNGAFRSIPEPGTMASPLQEVIMDPWKAQIILALIEAAHSLLELVLKELLGRW